MSWRWWGKAGLCVLASVLALPMMFFLVFVAFAPDGGDPANSPVRTFVLVWLALMAALVVTAWVALFRRGSSRLHRRSVLISLTSLTLSSLSWAVLIVLTVAFGD